MNLKKNQHLQIKPLSDMTEAEWEALCDGCGICCLEKIEYEDTKEVELTCVACLYLDTEKCVCRDYENRLSIVPSAL